MTLQSLSEAWKAISPVLGNHLWQSTLFATVAGVLTLALRKNHARARYWLWLAASVKFLIPFSLLVSLGGYLHWSHPAAKTNTGVYIAMEQISEPFAPPAAPAISAAAPAIRSFHFADVLPALVLVIWFFGFALILFLWCIRWLRLSLAVRKANLLRAGREVEALRNLERRNGIRKPIDVFQSSSSLEPGIFGIARPVLLWPNGISQRLDDNHLQAILAHELWHVRYRDNLAAAIHMLIEAAFWFHPLVWWLGTRLVHERELACDEAVVQMGNERQIYAESILKICEFCTEAPLACVSGVTGADLKKRIARIMTNTLARKLNFTKKLLLSTAATLAIALPIVLGSMLATSNIAAHAEGTQSTPFENVSIRGSQLYADGLMILVNADEFHVQNYSLRKLIAFAYDTQDGLITGPDLLDTKYNIVATPGTSQGGYEGIDAVREQVRIMLADRFQLKTHSSTQPVNAYVLTMGGTGNMHVAGALDHGPNMRVSHTSISVTAFRMNDFIELLAAQLGHPVIDKTGLTQTYNLTLDWKGSDTGSSQQDRTQAIMSALQTQLGLTLQPLQQNSANVVIVDGVQSPKDVITARKAISMDPVLFDPYTGYYGTQYHQSIHIYRDKDRFWAQLAGQGPIEVFPESTHNFFSNVSHLQVSFPEDTQGHAGGLTLNQGDYRRSATRIDEATAKQWEDVVKNKVQQQVPDPGSEPALRKLILQLIDGKPDYDQMSPEMAQLSKQQLAAVQAQFQSTGSLVSLKFTEVGPGGGDHYIAKFDQGSQEWTIGLFNGKIVWINAWPL